MIPGIVVEEVDGNEAVTCLDFFDKLTFRLNIGAQWLLRKDIAYDSPARGESAQDMHPRE